MFKKFYFLIIFISVLFLISLYCSLSFGTVYLPILNFFHFPSEYQNIILNIRLPRVLTAFLVGAILSVSGLSFQGIFKNPLAEPYILGVSSGAGFGIALASLGGILFLNNYAISLFALVGAGFSIFFLFFFLKIIKNFNLTNLILIGIIINSFFSALIFLIFFLFSQKIESLLFLLMGSCDRLELKIILLMLILTILICFLIISYLKQLNIMLESEEIAYSLGIKVNRVRLILIFLNSILVSFAVAMAGIIGFVGLVVPHIMRLFLKDDFRILFPFCFVFGGIFVMLADTLARTIFSPLELPVGVITAFIGAPFFLWILIRNNPK